MNIIQLPEPTPPTPAQRAASSILAHVNSAASQAIERQKLLHGMFWDSEATPDEILQEMGANAIAMLAAANESVRHLSSFAEIAGVEFADIIEPKYISARREFVIGDDGSVTIAPPADGFDAWGRPLPDPEPAPTEDPLPEEQP